MLLGGDKGADKRWYEKNIPIAEKRYEDHLERQTKEDEERKRKEQAQQKDKQK